MPSGLGKGTGLVPQLLRDAEIDDAPYPLGNQSGASRLSEASQIVGPDHGPPPRLSPVSGGIPPPRSRTFKQPSRASRRLSPISS